MGVVRLRVEQERYRVREQPRRLDINHTSVYARARASLGSCPWLVRGSGVCICASVSQLKPMLLDVFDSLKRTLSSLPSGLVIVLSYVVGL